jgi:hypothetical protein
MRLSPNQRIRQKAINRTDHDLAGVPSFRSKESVPSVLESEHVMRVMGVRLSCSGSKDTGERMVGEASENGNKVLDVRLTIPFMANCLGTGTAPASLYPSKLANSMLVRIVNKIDGLM